MTAKYYISAQELLEDSFRLGAAIIQSGFRPDFIVGVWRGGTPVGIAVQELLEYCGIETNHFSVRTSLYDGIDSTKREVRVHGLGYLVKTLNVENSLLIVDDVFDSGRSVQAVIQQLKDRTRRNAPHQIKVATPWYKPNKNQTDFEPDFYLHQTDEWLVFPHEIQGLDEDEIQNGKGGLLDIIQAAQKGMQ